MQGSQPLAPKAERQRDGSSIPHVLSSMKLTEWVIKISSCRHLLLTSFCNEKKIVSVPSAKDNSSNNIYFAIVAHPEDFAVDLFCFAKLNNVEKKFKSLLSIRFTTRYIRLIALGSSGELPSGTGGEGAPAKTEKRRFVVDSNIDVPGISTHDRLYHLDVLKGIHQKMWQCQIAL